MLDSIALHGVAERPDRLEPRKWEGSRIWSISPKLLTASCQLQRRPPGHDTPPPGGLACRGSHLVLGLFGRLRRPAEEGTPKRHAVPEIASGQRATKFLENRRQMQAICGV